MTINIDVQGIEDATISTRDHPSHGFAVAKITGHDFVVTLYFQTMAQAELVAAAIRNDRAALRAMLAEPPETYTDFIREEKAAVARLDAADMAQVHRDMKGGY